MSTQHTVALVLIIVLAGVVAWPRFAFYQHTGSWFPIRNVDTLRSPLAVTGWAAEGLRLADGRIVQLPGFDALPSKSAALTEATKRGIEMAGDGRIYALVEVLHHCGNDPVREHIARVDLANLLMFLREGEWTTPLSTEALEFAARQRGGTFSEYGGWDLGDFTVFTYWDEDLSRLRTW